MSWDVSLFKFSEYPLTNDCDISGLKRQHLGTVSEVRDLVSKQLPDVEWEAFYTGYYVGDECRLDLFVGSYDSDESDVIDHLDVSIHGLFSNEAINTLLRLAVPYRWTVQEMSEGHLILPEI